MRGDSSLHRRCCRLELRANVSEYQWERFVDGATKAACKVSERLAITVASVQPILLAWLVGIQLRWRTHFRNPNNATTSFIVESVRPSNETISSDKLNLFDDAIRRTVLFPTLVRELISVAKDCKPFWSDACKELSDKLWLPIETASPVSGSSSSSSSSRGRVDPSSCWIKRLPNRTRPSSRTTSSALYTSSVVAKWVGGNTNPPPAREVMRTMKIALRPTRQQIRVLTKWMGTHRFVYNKYLRFTRTCNRRRHPDWCNFQSMRNRFVNWNQGANRAIARWEVDTPKDIRADAIQAVVSAYKTNFTNLRKKNIQRFCMRYRSKKNSERVGYTIGISKSAVGFHKAYEKTDEKEPTTKKKTKRKKTKMCAAVDLYPRMMREALTETNNTNTRRSTVMTKIPIPKRQFRRLQRLRFDTISHDSKLHRDGTGRWWLLVPYTVSELKSDDDRPNKRARSIADTIVEPSFVPVGLDPGERAFVTGFSESECFTVSSRRPQLERLKARIDACQSRRSRHMRQRVRRLQAKHRRLVTDMHTRTAVYLRDHYTDVFLPHFETQEMVSTSRSLSKKTRRGLLGLRHYAFKQRMRTMIDSDFRVHEISEAYTTQTCTRCGCIHNPGTSRTYKCGECDLVIGRDEAAARNVLVKHLAGSSNGTS